MLFRESLLLMRDEDSWDKGSEIFKSKERRPEWEFDKSKC
jgi:hypothetical protein